MHPYHNLPVVDGKQLVGMVSQRDLLRELLHHSEHASTGRGTRSSLGDTCVRDLLHANIATARADDTLSAAARRMIAARASALPVVDEEQGLIGIITENDLTRVIALIAR